MTFFASPFARFSLHTCMFQVVSPWNSFGFGTLKLQSFMALVWTAPPQHPRVICPRCFSPEHSDWRFSVIPTALSTLQLGLNFRKKQIKKGQPLQVLHLASQYPFLFSDFLSGILSVSQPQSHALFFVPKVQANTDSNGFQSESPPFCGSLGRAVQRDGRGNRSSQ